MIQTQQTATRPRAAPLRENPSGYGVEYYTRIKAQGLDLLEYGDWQERYGKWLVDALALRGQLVLDVGCACGSMLRGLLRAGALIDGIDFSEVFVEMGRNKWPELQDRLFICDAINLHLIPDAAYDWLHSSVVAEHWKPGLVPFILAELLRVVKPGGSFYCAYESTLGAMADGRDPADELTHVCLKPPAWWENHLRNTGWQITSAEWERPLRSHPDSFFKEYTWAWFVARRPP